MPMTMTSTTNEIKSHKDLPLAGAAGAVATGAGVLAVSEDAFAGAASVVSAASGVLTVSGGVVTGATGAVAAAAGVTGILR